MRRHIYDDLLIIIRLSFIRDKTKRCSMIGQGLIQKMIRYTCRRYSMISSPGCSVGITHLHTFPAPWLPFVLWLFLVDIWHMWSVRIPVDKSRPHRWRTAPDRPTSRCPADTGLLGSIVVKPKFIIISPCPMVLSNTFNFYFALFKQKKVYW